MLLKKSRTTYLALVELYDLKENREKAIYHAVRSNDIELVKHLLMILTSGDIEIEFFKELEILLSEAYEELKEAGYEKLSRKKYKFKTLCV